jgi:hypothetical protein
MIQSRIRFKQRWAGSRRLEYRLNRLHGQEEPVGPVWERREIMVKIELPCACFGVYNDSPGSYPPGADPSPFQSVKQQEFFPALAVQRLSDGHAPEQRDRKRIPRQLLCQVIWEIGSQYRKRGKSVETGNIVTVRSENENSG